MSEHPKRECLAKVLGCGAIAFMSLVACAENIEKYLFATGTVWIIAGTIAAMCWAFEALCALKGGNDDD
ncbi:hypothetical protein KUD11_11010 [Roseovarius sp. LXJ103]|uniref:hypothetical protein n=1 Tax=Roseovarius carneus TaxID=2853164 RepID=UPI0011B27A88|nr:hypothetical protein [Roseovarius carneus]MBZ8119176.1 hypothetical protein [Roseovarius carneus]